MENTRTLVKLLFLSFPIIFVLGCKTDGQLNGVAPEYCKDKQSSSPFAGGTGTLSNPFTICTAAQFYNIGNDQTAWDKHFVQKADIDLSTISSIKSIGFYNYNSGSPIDTPFTGSYNGSNYKLSNLAYPPLVGNQIQHGIFGNILGATVKNIKVINFTLNEPSQSNVGVLVSYMQSGTVSNVSTTGTINVDSYSGGVLSYIDSGLIEDVHSEVTITGNSRIGGIAGYLGVARINKSSNKGNVTATNYVGGIAGSVGSGDITQSFNKGNIEGEGFVGGLFGMAGGTPVPELKNCYSTGNISGVGSGLGAGSQIGGIGGETGGALDVYNVWSSGTITSVGSKVGGLSGQNGVYHNSFSIADVSGVSSVGGTTGNLQVALEATYYSYYSDDDTGGGSGFNFGTQMIGDPTGVISAALTATPSPANDANFSTWDTTNIWDWSNTSLPPTLKWENQ
ncbi:hypothetical protein N9W41_01530 [bacterium]|nr:hypothetical protein [bacterium]